MVIHPVLGAWGKERKVVDKKEVDKVSVIPVLSYVNISSVTDLIALSLNTIVGKN